MNTSSTPRTSITSASASRSTAMPSTTARSTTPPASPRSSRSRAPSPLGDAAARVAKSMGLLISPDPQPEEVVFVRSDQYPFVKRGVPAIYVGSGYKAVDPKFDIEAEAVKWEETIYHSPKDDMSQ